MQNPPGEFSGFFAGVHHLALAHAEVRRLLGHAFGNLIGTLRSVGEIETENLFLAVRLDVERIAIVEIVRQEAAVSERLPIGGCG